MPVLTLESAWELTGAMSPRRLVRAADTMASGEVVNTYSRVHPINGLVPLVPWAVYLAERGGGFRLILVDFDQKGSGSAAADAAQFVALLDELAIAHVCCASSGSLEGGRHVWIALTDSLDAARTAHLARLMQSCWATFDPTPLLNAATGAGRPPGAPHRHGGQSEVLAGDPTILTRPTTTSADITALLGLLARRARAVEAQGHVGSPRTTLDDGAAPRLGGARRPLSATVRGLVDTTPTGDASAALWAILCGAARASWSLGEVAELLPRPGLEHARTKRHVDGQRLPRPSTGSNAPHAVLDRMWRRAVAYVAAHPATGADPTFEARAGAVTQLAWDLQRYADVSPGRWGSTRGVTDRFVLDAVTKLAVDAVKPEVEASIRTIAEIVGIDREAVRCALIRLVNEGWLTRTRTTVGRRAAYYSIDRNNRFHSLVERFLSQADAPPARRGTLQSTLTTRLGRASHDTFAPRTGLGRTAGLLYARLHEQDRTSTMATLTGLGQADVRNRFEQLASEGLIHYDVRAGTWSRVDLTAAQLDAHAVALGSAGHAARQRAQHSVERAMWSWWCAELEWMTAPRVRRARRGQRRAGVLQAALVPDRHDNVFGAHPRRGGRADFAAARTVVLRHHEFVEAA